jgi:hypothetical protein
MLDRSPYNLPVLTEIWKHGAEMAIEFLIEKDGTIIQHIDNPSRELQLVAVRQNREAIKHIKKPHYDTIYECNLPEFKAWLEQKQKQATPEPA